MLKNQRPIVMCIDEAHHLASHSTEAQRAKNLDAIKAFADDAPVPLLLMGTYELAEFASTSGRLGRRVREIHLARYSLDSTQDRREFRAVIAFLAKRLPLQGYDMLADHAYLQGRAQGCVGLLKQWCERALYAALADGRPHLRERDMKDAEPPVAVVNQWSAESARRGAPARAERHTGRHRERRCVPAERASSVPARTDRRPGGVGWLPAKSRPSSLTVGERGLGLLGGHARFRPVSSNRLPYACRLLRYWQQYASER